MTQTSKTIEKVESPDDAKQLRHGPVKVFGLHEDSIVFDDRSGNWCARVDAGWMTTDQRRIVAKRIATAMNNHESLLAACRVACGHVTSPMAQGGVASREILEAAADALRTAIAKASGGAS